MTTTATRSRPFRRHRRPGGSRGGELDHEAPAGTAPAPTRMRSTSRVIVRPKTATWAVAPGAGGRPLGRAVDFAVLSVRLKAEPAPWLGI